MAATGRTIKILAGDTMVSIAHAYGYRSWEGIYFHGNNEALRATCPDPSILKPGEALFIPDKGTEDFLRPTTQRHIFKVKTLKAQLKFSVGNEEKAFANAPYELRIDSDPPRAGTTDGEGVIDVKVRPNAQRAIVKVWPDREGEPTTWRLQVGFLDPIDLDNGARMRLQNLGYHVASGEDGMRDALSLFQYAHELEITSILDGPTLSKLREASGV